MRRVAVLDERGNLLGTVPQSATSVAAAKLAGGAVCFARRDSGWVWERKEQRRPVPEGWNGLLSDLHP